MRNRRFLILSLALVTLIAAFFIFGRSPVVELVIMHTNDHHGYCWSKKDKGGLAKQLTLVKQARERHKNVLLVSGGDINTGFPESDINQAEPSFKGMRLLGFDAMAVGNHEFDVRLSLLRQQEAWGGFPFLSANIYKKGTNQRAFTPYVIKEVDGLKVALIGLTTEETSYIAKFAEDLEFRDPVQEAKKIISELKDEADLIIALTHMGYYSDRHHPVSGKTDVELAKENPEISVIVGGHSHTLLREPIKVGQTFLLQAHHYAKNMGELKLRIKKGKVISSEYQMHDLDEKIAEDPEMVTLLSPYLANAKVLFDEKVGETKLVLDGVRNNVRSKETNLGNLITDLFREVTKADIAIQNGGGIRSPIDKGVISYRDVRQAFPFDNTIVHLKLSGSEILEVLNLSASLRRPAGGFLQVSGLKFIIEKNRVTNVYVNGKPLSLERVYTVATNDFIANGGDGYSMLKDKPRIDTGFKIAGTLKNYLKGRSSIAPAVEGRIAFR